MIIRELNQIKESELEEQLKSFDWFNDYKDTRAWAKRCNLQYIVLALDIGYQMNMAPKFIGTRNINPERYRKS